MKTERIVRTLGLLSIVGAVGLLLWWFLIPVLLPIPDSSENFQNLMLDDNWVAINIPGLVSTLLFTLGFPGFYLKNHGKFNQLGFRG